MTDLAADGAIDAGSKPASPSLRERFDRVIGSFSGLRPYAVGLKMRRLYLNSSRYADRLAGPVPERILVYPRNFKSGSMKIAEQLDAGRYALKGGVKTIAASEMPWSVTPPSRAWLESVHAFEWIRHLLSKPDDLKLNSARAMISAWLEHHDSWDDVAWQPHIVGRRIISWLQCGREVFENGEAGWAESVSDSILRQARHIYYSRKQIYPGVPSLTSAVALALVSVCFAEGRPLRRRAMAFLRSELDSQIRADGGHLSRNPSLHASILCDLISLVEVLCIRGETVPAWLTSTVHRMKRVLRLYQHGDGRLALFNGSEEGQNAVLNLVLSTDGDSKDSYLSAEEIGFQKLAQNRTSVIADCGGFEPGQPDACGHAGCSSFEMSSGPHRIVVNCGAALVQASAWQDLLRSTAAHSTISIADRSSATFIPGRDDLPAISGPHVVSASQEKHSDFSVLRIGHHGYEPVFNVSHQRELKLSKEGFELEGKDSLECLAKNTRSKSSEEPASQEKAAYFARFHLHPDVRVNLARDEKSAILMLPNGEGWRFRAEDKQVLLDDSIYLGDSAHLKKTKQLVVQGVVPVQPGAIASVSWCFARMDNEPTLPLQSSSADGLAKRPRRSAVKESQTSPSSDTNDADAETEKDD